MTNYDELDKFELATTRIALLENALITAARKLSEENLIYGIQAYRAATGLGLGESKDYCQRFRKPAKDYDFGPEIKQKNDDARIQRLEDRLYNLERRVD